jgi:hypothetical protein
MPRPSRYLYGTRYDRLVLLEREGPLRVLCACDCGVIKSIMLKHVLAGLTRSCGCLHKELMAAAMTAMNTTHGMYGTPVNSVWNSMLDRCRNPNNHAYASYGERGITVCKRWLKFENFYADMGEPNGLTLERINNERGYSKANCKWATWKEQANNRRTNLAYKVGPNTTGDCLKGR